MRSHRFLSRVLRGSPIWLAAIWLTTLAGAGLAQQATITNPLSLDIISREAQASKYVMNGTYHNADRVSVRVLRGAVVVAGPTNATLNGNTWEYIFNSAGLVAANNYVVEVTPSRRSGDGTFIVSGAVVNNAFTLQVGANVTGALTLNPSSIISNLYVNKNNLGRMSGGIGYEFGLQVSGLSTAADLTSVILSVGGTPITYTFSATNNVRIINNNSGTSGIPHFFDLGNAPAEGFTTASATITTGTAADLRIFRRSFIVDLTSPTIVTTNAPTVFGGLATFTGTTHDLSGIKSAQVILTKPSDTSWSAKQMASLSVATNSIIPDDTVTWSLNYDFASLVAAGTVGQFNSQVVITDNAGNTSTSAVTAFTVDRRLPIVAVSAVTPPALVGGTVVPNVSIQFTVTRPLPNPPATPALVDYDIIDTVGGKTIYLVKGSSAGLVYGTPVVVPNIPASVLADGLHSFVVVVRDAQGNSVTSSPAATFTVDNTKPLVVLDVASVTAYGNKVLKTVPLSPAIKATVTDVNPNYWHIILDGTEDTLNDRTGALTWDGPFTEGSHSVQFKAFDKLGNTGLSDTITFVIDTIKPTITLNAITTPNSGDVTVTGTISNEANLGTWVLKVDGVQIGTGTGAAVSVVWRTKGFADGARNVTLDATDAAGNAGTQKSQSVTVDNTPPDTLTLALSPNATIVSGLLTVSGTTTEPAKTQILVDDVKVGSVSALSSSFSLTYAPLEGPHNIRVFMTDALNNSGQSTNFFSVIVDNTPPAVLITRPRAWTPQNDGSSAAKPVSMLANEPLLVTITDKYMIGTHADFLVTPVDTMGTATGTPVGPTVRTVDLSGRVLPTTLTDLGVGAFPAGTIFKIDIMGFDGALPANTKVATIYVQLGASLVSINSLTIVADSTLPGGDVDHQVALIGGVYYVRSSVRAYGTVNVANLDNWKLELYDAAGTTLVMGNLGNGKTNLTTPSEVTVDIAGVSTPLFTGTYNVPLASLPTGLYTLRLTATAIDTSTSKGEVQVFIDNLAPRTAFTAPANGAFVNPTSGVDIKGRAADLGGGLASYQLFVDGVEKTPIGPANSIKFTMNAVDWVDGLHILRLKAVDLSGNPYEVVSTVTVDRLKPTLSISVTPSTVDPLDSAKLYVNTTPTIVGTANDANLDQSTVKLTVGANAPVSGSTGAPLTSSTATFSSALVEGSNAVSLTAKDLAGNSETLNRTVIYDTTAPTLSLTAKTAQGVNVISGGIYTSSQVPFMVTATVTDANLRDWQVTDNGVVIPELTGNRTTTTATASLPVTVAGSHLLVLTATDFAGNSKSTSISFLFSSDVSIVAPTLKLFPKSGKKVYDEYGTEISAPDSVNTFLKRMFISDPYIVNDSAPSVVKGVLPDNPLLNILQWTMFDFLNGSTIVGTKQGFFDVREKDNGGLGYATTDIFLPFGQPTPAVATATEGRHLFRLTYFNPVASLPADLDVTVDTKAPVVLLTQPANPGGKANVVGAGAIVTIVFEVNQNGGESTWPLQSPIDARFNVTGANSPPIPNNPRMSFTNVDSVHFNSNVLELELAQALSSSARLNDPTWIHGVARLTNIRRDSYTVVWQIQTYAVINNKPGYIYGQTYSIDVKGARDIVLNTSLGLGATEKKMIRIGQ